MSGERASEGAKRDSNMMEELRRMRDELSLQIHLGKAEAKEEWDRLEAKWQQLEQRQGPVKDAVKETGKNVGAAMDMAGEELKRGYERIRDLLKD